MVTAPDFDESQFISFNIRCGLLGNGAPIELDLPEIHREDAVDDNDGCQQASDGWADVGKSESDE